MKFAAFTSILFLTMTSAYADCTSSFQAGYKNAVTAQQACNAGKKAYQSISTFMNSAEENCGYSKETLKQYQICKDQSQKGIGHFNQVSSHCNDHNGAQNNIRILETFIADADYNISPTQNLIKMFCK